jgi:hypothetical protein
MLKVVLNKEMITINYVSTTIALLHADCGSKKLSKKRKNQDS